MNKTISITDMAISTAETTILNSQFETLFGVTPTTWTESTQKQALQLLYRIETNTLSPVDSHGIVLETPEIPFGIHNNLTESILQTRIALTQKVQNSLNTTFEKSKTKLYIMSANTRPGFVARTSHFEKLELTSDLVHNRQDATTASPKYPKQVVVYDITKRTYIQDDFTAIDHADPWALIVARVNAFLDFVNNAHHSVKSVLTTKVLDKHPEYFMLTGSSSGNLGATEFLAISLYNDASNLVVLNSPGNTSKNKKAFEVWISTIPNLKDELCQSIATDPTSRFEDLLDNSGFIVKFKCDNSVKPEYRGQGLAIGLCSLMHGPAGVSLADKRKAAINGVKNHCLIDTFEDYIRQVDAEGHDSSGLKEILSTFIRSLGKGIGSKAQRNATTDSFVEILQCIDSTRAEDVRLKGSPSSSEDELTSTKRELTLSKKRTIDALELAHSERLAKETERLAKETERLAKEAAIELVHSERLAKETERLAKEDAIQKALAAEAELAALKQSLGLT
jgi:hypothetical protein